MTSVIIGCPEEGGVNLPLVGGTSNQHGLVEVCVGGDYYPVSLSNFGVEEASVLCRSAGLSAGKSKSVLT